MLYLDTNIILRYLLEDCEQFIEQSKEYIENNNVYIKNEVLAEVVYVLNKTYKVPKNLVNTTVKEFITNDNVVVDSLEVIMSALEIFETKNIDFVDSLLCAYNKLLKYQVVSFDKKLNKCMESIS
jgi:predicted nucleic-acid-binding protein